MSVGSIGSVASQSVSSQAQGAASSDKTSQAQQHHHRRRTESTGSGAATQTTIQATPNNGSGTAVNKTA